MHSETRSLLQSHLTFLLSLTWFGLLVLRLLAMSGWDLNTALAVVEHGGAVNLALGSAVASLPLLVVFPIGYIFGRAIVAGRRPHWMVILATAVVLLFFSFVAPISAVLTPVVFLGGVWLLAVLASRFSKAEPATAPELNLQPQQRGALIAVVALVLAFSLSSKPWLPTERIEVQQEQPFTAFVLSEDSESTWLLTSGRSAYVRQVPTDAVSHQICGRATRWYDRTLPGAFAPPRPYPICPR